MRNLKWKPILTWALIAFFVVGGIGNVFISTENAANYARWGYPNWFHYVTGLLELTTAILLAYRPLRLWGAAVGGMVMTAAVATVLLHGEYTHAIAPIIVLLVTLAVGQIARRDQLSARPLVAGRV